MHSSVFLPDCAEERHADSISKLPQMIVCIVISFSSKARNRTAMNR
jgi:hypothetical protein